MKRWTLDESYKRLISYITPEPNSGCWLWLGVCDTANYGRIMIQTKRVMAHRWLYEYLKGPIKAGYQLDHKCRVTSCVNPNHLQPVSPYENTLRGTAPAIKRALSKTCINGHAFTPENSRIIYDKREDRYNRTCRKCWNEYMRKYRKSHS